MSAAARQSSRPRKASAREGEAAADAEDEPKTPGAMTTSRFWGVSWNRRGKKWQAQYCDRRGKSCYIGLFDDEEEAARAVNKAICDAGLKGKRQTNAVDATGALVPRETHARKPRDRAAVVAPDPARDPTPTTSKFWGVTWHKSQRVWMASYTDANGKMRHIGSFDTQEQAAHAVNAAIRRAGLEGRRKTNPVVDGQLVPKPPGPHNKKRRREEPAAAAPSTCPICLDPTTVTLVCGHAMCEECMGRLAVFQGQTLTRSRRRVVIQCPLRCDASTERVLA